MKKRIVLWLDKLFFSIPCIKCTVGFTCLYYKEILDIYISPAVEWVVNPETGEKEIKFPCPPPPKWHRSWMCTVEYWLAELIYWYLKKNRDIIRETKKTPYHYSDEVKYS